MELQTLQNGFELTLTYQLDAGLTQLRFEPSVGKTVLVRGMQEVDEDEKQRAFITLEVD